MKSKKRKTLNLKQICAEIDLIIAGKNVKEDYEMIFLYLEEKLKNEPKFEDIVLFCETVVKIASTKNRILRHLEKDFWHSISLLPYSFMRSISNKTEEDVLIEPNIEYQDATKKSLSLVLGMVVDFLHQPDDKSKSSELRRTNALIYLENLTSFFHAPVAKELFIKFIKSPNEKEQYHALEGLACYYQHTEDELGEELVETLDKIRQETDDRSIASTSLQIQINAGIIDEMEAVFEMDDWKDEEMDDEMDDEEDDE